MIISSANTFKPEALAQIDYHKDQKISKNDISNSYESIILMTEKEIKFHRYRSMIRFYDESETNDQMGIGKAFSWLFPIKTLKTDHTRESRELAAFVLSHADYVLIS